MFFFWGGEVSWVAFKGNVYFFWRIFWGVVFWGNVSKNVLTFGWVRSLVHV